MLVAGTQPVLEGGATPAPCTAQKTVLGPPPPSPSLKINIHICVDLSMCGGEGRGGGGRHFDRSRTYDLSILILCSLLFDKGFFLLLEKLLVQERACIFFYQGLGVAARSV